MQNKIQSQVFKTEADQEEEKDLKERIESAHNTAWYSVAFLEQREQTPTYGPSTSNELKEQS